MREKTAKKTALLVTEDPAVETTVRSLIEKTGDVLRHAITNEDAMCVLDDAFPSETFVVVDLDGHSGRRCLLNTAVGKVPVIAISGKARPWLRSMLQHRLIGASLSKPLSLDALTEAFGRIRHFDEGYTHFAA